VLFAGFNHLLLLNHLFKDPELTFQPITIDLVGLYI
jgi:hypothetical protein